MSFKNEEYAQRAATNRALDEDPMIAKGREIRQKQREAETVEPTYITTTNGNTFTAYCLACGGVAVYSHQQHTLWHEENENK